MKYYIIPNLSNLDKALKYSKEYNLGFEYNDFFNPDVLDDEDLLKKSLLAYKNLNRLNQSIEELNEYKGMNIKKIDLVKIEKSINEKKDFYDYDREFHKKVFDILFSTEYNPEILKKNINSLSSLCDIISNCKLAEEYSKNITAIISAILSFPINPSFLL